MVTQPAGPTDDQFIGPLAWESRLDALPRLGVVNVIVGWGIGRALSWALRSHLRHSRTPSFANVISKLTWIVVIVSVPFAAAVTFPSVKPVDLLIGLGFFSVAAGFAFQDIFENTLAGVLPLPATIPGRRPDQCRRSISYRDEISIRATRITTFAGESVTIPNRDVYKNVILVHTHHDTHRLQFNIGIAYDNDAEQATRAIVHAQVTPAGNLRHDKPTTNPRQT